MLSTLKYIIKQFPFIYPKGIIYSTKKWIKKANSLRGEYFLTRGNWAVKLEEKEFNQHPLPINIHPKDYHKFINFTHHFTPKAFLFYLTDVEIYGQRGEILTNRNYLLQEFSHNFMITPIKKYIYQTPFKYFRFQQRKINGVAAILTSPSSFDYYHWIYDVLARIHLYHSIKDQVDFFIVSNKVSPFLLNTLTYFNITPEKIILIGENEKIHFEKLFISSLSGSEGRNPKWSVQFLRASFLPLIKPLTIKRKIFLTRGNVPERKLINENEVTTLLNKYDFESVDMGKLSFLSQLETLHNASVIVGLHGGAFANLILAQEQTKVLEIFSPDYMRTDCFYTLSCKLNLSYWYLVAEKTKECKWGDAYVDLTILEKTIQEIVLN